MDLDDEFARDHGGYGGYSPAGPMPYDPTFNPHGVGAYSDYDESEYDYNDDQGDEFENGQRVNVSSENVTQTTNRSPSSQNRTPVINQTQIRREIERLERTDTFNTRYPLFN